MTEEAWLRCNNPTDLFRGLGLWPDLRRSRCLARAALEPYLPDAFNGDGAPAMALLDQWADQAEPAARQGQLARTVVGWVRGITANDVPEFPRVIAQRLGMTYPRQGRWRPVDPRHPDRQVASKAIRCEPSERVCRLIRDIFGNPFRPISFDPSWRTETAFTLVRQMNDSRDFSAMPILADALQDAGCDNEDILTHCREPGEHVRGCWVVDLVLGRE